MEIKNQASLRGGGRELSGSSFDSRRGQSQIWLLISVVLLAVGLSVTFYGASIGLRALNGLYSGAVNDALGQPDGTEERVSTEMFKGVLIGAAGTVPLLCGTVMFRVWKARRKAHNLNANKL